MVVRHRLADGRASDVVGELRSWDDEQVRVLADRGDQGGSVVVVRSSAVVAARVVETPRARVSPTAHQGVGDPLGATADVAARCTALGWAAPHGALLGDWLLRSGAGRMMRASSALAVGDPGRPTGEALAAVARHYRERSQVPAVQVAAPLPGGSASGAQGADELEEALARDGWQPRPWTVLALRPTPSTPPPSRPSPTSRVEVSPSASPAWLAASDHHGSPLTAADLPPERDAVAVAHAGAPAPGTGSAAPLVAVARGALAQRWLGITCVSVDPAHRRRGLAGSLTDALLDDLGGPEATDALYVQVVASNEVARATWSALGFLDHSRYRFWTLPGA